MNPVKSPLTSPPLKTPDLRNKSAVQWVPVYTFIILFFQSLIMPASAAVFETVSLKKYKQLSLVVPNPLDLTKLPAGKTFQINSAKFLLQFFFDGTNIYGVIFKRKKEVSLFVKWCFFKSCEESPYNYTAKIADAYKPPFNQLFFSVKLPARMSYEFQGMEYFTKP